MEWSPSSTNETKNDALGRAVTVGDAAEAKRTLDAGADPNWCIPWEFHENWGGQHQSVPVLTIAAREGYENIVVRLLEAKADTESTGDHQATPLIRAAGMGHIAIVKRLLDNGANIHSKETEFGAQAIHYAIGYQRLEVAKLLHEQGANLQAKTKLGDTPLHAAARRGSRREAEWLLQQGVDVTATNNDGQTAAGYAEAKGHKELANWLRSWETAQQQNISTKKLDKRKIRKVVVLNYTKFPPPLTVRQGAEKDSTNLRVTFEKLGYNVAIHENLSSSATEDVFNNIQADTSMECLILVILSHGKNKYCFYTGDGSIMDLDIIRKKFTDSACPQLKGFTKIILANFCRGKDLELLPDASAHVEVPHNMVTVHACVDNVKALRHPRDGTVFISSLCKVLKQNQELQETLNKLYEEMRDKRGTTPMTETFLPFPKFTF